MTRATFGPSAAVPASRSTIEATISASYGVMPRAAARPVELESVATSSNCVDHPPHDDQLGVALLDGVGLGVQHALEQALIGRQHRRAATSGSASAASMPWTVKPGRALLGVGQAGGDLRLGQALGTVTRRDLGRQRLGVQARRWPR